MLDAASRPQGDRLPGDRDRLVVPVVAGKFRRQAGPGPAAGRRLGDGVGPGGPGRGVDRVAVVGDDGEGGADAEGQSGTWPAAPAEPPADRREAGGERHRQRGRGKIHPVLHTGVVHRLDARRRSEQQKKSQPQPGGARMAAQGEQAGRQRSGEDEAGAGQPPAGRERHAVVEALPDRHHEQGEVPENHGRLVDEVQETVLQPGRGAGELRIQPALRGHDAREDEPRRRQRRVPAAAPGKRLPPRFSDHEHIEEQDERRHDDEPLLAGHACRGAGDAGRDQQALAWSAGIHGREKRGQCAEGRGRRQQFDPLVDVAHRLGLDRMEEPDRGGDRGDGVRVGRRFCRQPSRAAACERPGHEPPEQPAVAKVDEQVEDVVAERFEAAEGMVHREREVRQRPVRQLAAREHRPRRRPEHADRRIGDDLGEVVEQKIALQGRRIGDRDHGGEQDREADGARGDRPPAVNVRFS